MQSVSLKQIETDFETIKSAAYRYYENGSYEECLTAIEFACKLANTFNFCYFDENLENLCLQISNDLNKGSVISKAHSTEPRFVFYDCFAWDNRGLTQQYIRALKQWNVPFLFIFASGSSVMSSEILKELEETENATILFVESNLTKTEKIKFITHEIMAYRPSIAFLHMSPWDSVGTVVWNARKEVVKYQINLTDHAFWLGTKCSDFCIEFRDYGFNVSTKHRGFNAEQAILQPYYPIVGSKSKFQGFPADVTGKVVIFTGGTYYKMYGKGQKFFGLLKQVLLKHAEVVVFIAGGGKDEPIKNFIKHNKFEKRIILLGNRKDIGEVFQNIDIYMGTYPLAGGLMTQLAASYSKNVIAYTDPDLKCNMLNELVETSEKIVFFEEKMFLDELSHLITDKDYRYKKSLTIKPIITPEEFNKSLYKLIFLQQSTTRKPVPYYVDVEKLRDLYIECDNDYVHSYSNIIYNFTLFNGIKSTGSMLWRSTRYLVGRIMLKMFSFKHR